MPTLNAELFGSKGGKLDAIALEVPRSAGHEFKLSYAQLQASTAKLQRQIAGCGIPRGATVSSSLINGAEFVGVFLATAAQGLVAAPLNPNYKESEVRFYLDDTQSKLLVVPSGALRGGQVSDGAKAAVSAGRAEGVRMAEVVLDVEQAQMQLVDEHGQPLPDGAEQQADPEDTALVLHTSGTTGRPKAVPLTHRNLAASMHNIQKTYELSPSDKSFIVMPLFHVHGLLCGLLASLLAGGSVVLPPRFSASSFWDEFVHHGANWYTAVPTIHQILLNSPRPDPLPNLRFVRSCSSSLSAATFRALEEALQAPVLEAYAMTEAAHQMTSNPLPPGTRKPGAVGYGHGVEVRVLNERGEELPPGTNGEVCVRGANVTKGYVNNDKANRDSFFRTAYGNCPPDVDGFLRTGDQGHKDDDGYLVLTGRIKELINRSGEKISPLEVDAALLEVPGIKEAVSFGIPDPMYGEVVGAAVVLQDDAKQSVTDATIRNALSQKIIKFKVPERIWIADSIPKTYVSPAPMCILTAVPPARSSAAMWPVASWNRPSSECCRSPPHSHHLHALHLRTRQVTVTATEQHVQPTAAACEP